MFDFPFSVLVRLQTAPTGPGDQRILGCLDILIGQNSMSVLNLLHPSFKESK